MFRDVHGALAGIHPKSRLGRSSEAVAVNGFQDFVAAAREQTLASNSPQFFRSLEKTVTRIAQDLRTVGGGNDRIEVQFAVADISKSSDGNLASSAEAAEQCAFASCGCAGCGIIEK